MVIYSMFLGTNLNLNIAFRLWTDKQSEKTIQILENLLRSSALELKGN
jgi:hypothetical protein